MNKVWLPGVQTDDSMDLTSWMWSIINNPDDMHIYHQVSEWDWGFRLDDQEKLDLHNRILSEKPDNVRFIFGCGELVRHADDGTPKAFSPMSFRHLFPGWDEAVINFEHSFMLNASWHLNPWNDRYVRYQTEFYGNYVCMMNKPHWHRKRLLEILLDNDPELLGYVTWCPQQDSWRNFLEHHRETPGLLERILPHMHKIQHQGEHPVTSKHFNFFECPRVYGNFFIDIVSESSTDVLYFTEKTVRPIVFGKPFILLGAPGANKRLRELGFQLFDELFDYSLEPTSITHKTQATEWYSKIIKPIFSLTQNDITELNHIWQRVYRANQQLLKHIVMSDDYIPEILKPEIYDGNAHFPNYHRDIQGTRDDLIADAVFNQL